MGYSKWLGLIPWEEMEPGNSFFVPCGIEDVPIIKRKISHTKCAFYASQGLKARIVIRDVKDGIRVWLQRIKPGYMPLDKIAIDKNIPMPGRVAQGGTPCKYPWKTLQPGKSFCVKCDPYSDIDGRKKNMYALGNNFYKRHGIDAKVSAKRDGDNIVVKRVK